jgi:O-antigen/teichoic acid export membrane protein
MVSAAFPIFARAARDDHARLAYAVQRTFEAAAVAGALVALALSLGAPFAIDVVAGPDFGPAKDVLSIQALSFVASFPAMVLAFALLSVRRHRELLVVNALALGFTATLVSVLAEVDGARGAAIGTTTGEFVLAVALAGALQRAAPHLRPRLGILPKIALAGVAGGALALLPLGALPLALAASVVFTLVLLVVGGIPEEMLVELRKLRFRERHQ